MKTVMNKMNVGMIRMQAKLNELADETKKKWNENRGDFILDHAMVFVIILVVGGIALMALKTYIDGEFTNLVKTKINEFFN